MISFSLHKGTVGYAMFPGFGMHIVTLFTDVMFFAENIVCDPLGNIPLATIYKGISEAFKLDEKGHPDVQVGEHMQKLGYYGFISEGDLGILTAPVYYFHPSVINIA